MNITLTGVKIQQDTKTLAFRKNNLVDVMNITVDTDDSWEYKIDVEYPVNQSIGEKLYNVIDLVRNGNVCSVGLMADMLPFNGKYTMQLRGISGDKVYHTDTFEVWVKYSIDVGDVYTPVPSEFYQIENNITEINNHPPKPSDDGYWMIWDVKTHAYQKSDISIKAESKDLPEVDESTGGKWLTNDGENTLWADNKEVEQLKTEVDEIKTTVDSVITTSGASIKVYTNYLLNAINTSGAIYNGIGYELDKRFRSSGVEADSVGDFVTGYIPVQAGDVLRMNDYVYIPSLAFADNTGITHYYYCYIYDNNFNLIKIASFSAVTEDYITQKNAVDGRITSLVFGINESIAYVRFNGVYDLTRQSDSEKIITDFVTGSIINTRIYQEETGYALDSNVKIPQIESVETNISKLEDRLTAVEQEVDDLKNQTTSDTIQKYKYQLDKAMTTGYISSPEMIPNNLGLKSMLNFLHITDTHGSPNVKNAVDILNYLGDKARCKFILHTGDFFASTFADNFTTFQSYVDSAKYPFMFVSGNHDVGNQSKTAPQAATDEELYERCFKDNIPNWRLKTDSVPATGYTNLLPLAINTEGEAMEYEDGYRLSSSGVTKVQNGIYTTGFIPINAGDTVYFKDVDFGIKVSNGIYNYSGTGERYISFFNSSFANRISSQIQSVLNGTTSSMTIDHTDNEDGTVTINSVTYSGDDVAYIRYCAQISARTGEEIVATSPIVDSSQTIPEPHPDSKNYWYTDFTNEKVRVIGLYNFECDYSDPAVYNETTQTLYNARGYAAYRQEQIDWFLNVLLTTPANYGVVVATHNPHNLRGTLNNPFNGIYLQGRNTSQTYVDKNMIPDIIQAFMDGAQINKTYAQTKGVITNLIVNADFSKKNTGVEFVCYLDGHTHADGVSFLQDYPKQLEINGNCDNYHYQHYSDIYNQVDTLHQDAINYVSIDRNRGYVYILRIGNDFTGFAGRRDFTAINYRNPEKN